MRVLIVDDHAVVRHGLKSAIQTHGYEVVAAAGSTNEAKAFMAQTNPDAIIVDINVPDLMWWLGRAKFPQLLQ